MTANHEQTPSREQFKALLTRIPAKYGEVIAHTAVLDDFDHMIDATIAAAEQRGAVKELKKLLQHFMEGEFPLGHHAGLHTASTTISARLVEIWDRADLIEDDADQIGEITYE